MTCRWLTAAMVAAPMLLAAGAQAEDRALLVGVGTHERTSAFPDLKGIDKDLVIMQEVVRTLGFEESQIRVLADEEATYDGIERAFESWLIDAVGPGERALFYFSGHGHYRPDTDGDEPDGRDEVLVPHDYRGTAQALTNVIVDDDIAAWMSRLRTGEVLVFLDACHSGTAVRSAGAPATWSLFDGEALGGPASRNAAGLVAKSPGGDGSGYLALAAARDSEQAQATSNGSTFTIGIGRAVREAATAGALLTMNRIRAVAAAEIARAHPDKLFHPVLSGDVARADDDLRRRGRPPLRSLWERLNAAVGAASRPVDLSGVRPAYRLDDLMTLEVVMPVDGYLSVLTVTEGADDAAVLFPHPWSTRRTPFRRGERVRVPERDVDLVMEFEDPNHQGDERNLLVVVVSDSPARPGSARLRSGGLAARRELPDRCSLRGEALSVERASSGGGARSAMSGRFG